jgi:hypothetical protein
MTSPVVLVPIRTSTLSALFTKIADSGMSPDEMIEKILAVPEIGVAARTTVPALEDRAQLTTYEILIFGQRFTASTLRQVLSTVLGTFSDLDSGFCELLSRKRTHARRYIARDRAGIYISSPHLKSEAFEFRPGWWVGTNNSRKQVVAILEASCDVLGLQYGHDLIFR